MIPHKEKFTREDALKAAEVFNRAGKAAKDAGLRYGYHTHGYENVPSPEGTLFDTLAKNSDPALVFFQVDVFHTYHGGGDPAKVITQYKGRVRSLHLKDIKKASRSSREGAPPPRRSTCRGHGTRSNGPTVLRAAIAAGRRSTSSRTEQDPAREHPKSVASWRG